MTNHGKPPKETFLNFCRLAVLLMLTRCAANHMMILTGTNFELLSISPQLEFYSHPTQRAGNLTSAVGGSDGTGCSITGGGVRVHMISPQPHTFWRHIFFRKYWIKMEGVQMISQHSGTFRTCTNASKATFNISMYM